MFKRRATALIAAVFMFMSMTVSGFAAVGNGGETSSPNYLYTKEANVKLSISNGTATATSTIKGYPGQTTKIGIYMYLEKYNENRHNWDTIRSWNKTVNGASGELEKSTSVSSGIYRVRTSFWVYAGSKSENITRYSSNVIC